MVYYKIVLHNFSRREMGREEMGGGGRFEEKRALSWEGSNRQRICCDRLCRDVYIVKVNEDKCVSASARNISLLLCCSICVSLSSAHRSHTECLSCFGMGSFLLIPSNELFTSVLFFFPSLPLSPSFFSLNASFVYLLRSATV